MATLAAAAAPSRPLSTRSEGGTQAPPRLAARSSQWRWRALPAGQWRRSPAGAAGRPSVPPAGRDCPQANGGAGGAAGQRAHGARRLGGGTVAVATADLAAKAHSATRRPSPSPGRGAVPGAELQSSASSVLQRQGGVLCRRGYRLRPASHCRPPRRAAACGLRGAECRARPAAAVTAGGMEKVPP